MRSRVRQLLRCTAVGATMAKGFPTHDRVILLLSLVPYLRDHGPTTVTELARVFGVRTALLRELITFLGTAGIPGETRTYQPEDLFDIDWAAFEDDDVVSLTQLVAIDETPRFSPFEHAALVAGLHALTPLLPESERANARSAAAKLASIAPQPAEQPALSVDVSPAIHGLPAVLEAIRRGRQLAFHYRDLNGVESERRVDPLRVSEEAGGWYLRAHCTLRDAERTFLVSAMRQLRVLDTTAVHPAEVAHETTSSTAPVRHPAGAGVIATVRVRASAMPRVASFAPEVRGEAGPGWVRVQIELTHAHAAIRLVQLAPGSVVVEEPAGVRAVVAAWADRALAPYED